MPLSLMGQSGKAVRVGVDASADYFIAPGRFTVPSAGIGVRVRWGRQDQWFNVVGGLRYIYGPRLQGPQIPVMLNANLLKMKKASAYLGAGYEFDFIGTYWGCMKFQAGLLANEKFDFRIFYKPYQKDLGIGFTYYF